MRYFSRIEWFKWRREGITGTDASIIMRAYPESWGTVPKLWLEKARGEVDHKKQTTAMRRGLELEPAALDEYTRRKGHVMTPEVMVENAANPILRATLDGLNHEAGIVYENKCPNAADHAVAVAGKIPPKYLWQCVHNLMVTELPVLHYNSFDGKTGETVVFERDLKLEEQLKAEELQFWDLVQRDVAPPRTPSVREDTLLKTGAKIFTLRRTK